MDPKGYYDSLWHAKVEDRSIVSRRDWVHRYFLDPFFDPAANTRQDVTLGILPPGNRLLDIGCWNGTFLSRVRDAGLYKELFGVDLVEKGVAEARSKGFAAQTVDLNGEPLPFPDAHFDAVTILAVLEHVFDPYAMMREIRRVLRPGGTLVIDVPNAASFTNRLRIMTGRIPVTSGDPGWDGGHLHYFTRLALDRLLDQEGFDVLERRTSGGRPQLREWWISLLAGELIYLCRRR